MRAGLSASAFTILALPAAASANEGSISPTANETAGLAEPDNDAGQDDDFHDRRLDYDGAIIVTAIGLSQLDVLAGTSVLEGAQLHRNLSGQIGDVLAKLPGVSSTGFSPGASRPVLRGFAGKRVRVLVDGIGALDASNVSADHAVSIDPLNAERVEVLRGPAVMLYGSQAIGGVVNIIDKRIPLRPLKEAVHFDALLGADSAADLRQGGASADVRIDEGIVFHIDGSYSETGDLAVPGFVLAPTLRADLLAQAGAAPTPAIADQIRTIANQRGTLANSAVQTHSINAGFSLFRGGSDMGAAIGMYDTKYGVATRPEGAEAETVTIDLHQERADFRGKLALGAGFFSSLHTRFGYSDYTHSELEDGQIGTTFNVKGFEGRAVLEQAGREGWKGSIGGQFYFRDFEAIGDEAYIAPNLTGQFALFAVQEIMFGPVQLEMAGRYEHSNIESRAANFDRSFDSFSGAVSLAHQSNGGLRFGITGSRAQRAPSAEELLAHGAHIATQVFEVGDHNLTSETVWGIEGFLRGQSGPVTIDVAVYHSWFSDYIYLDATGVQEDGLPVFQYVQGDVTYSGIEGELSFLLGKVGPLEILADLRGDYTRASLADGTPLPRIPPISLLGALEAQADHIDLRAEVQWSGSQNRIAAHDTATDGFIMVNASAAWKPLRDNQNLTLLFQADNIFNAEGRRAASFTKDFVPLAGRNLKVSARVSF